MQSTLASPVLGLENDFPDLLYVLNHPASGRYGCFCHQETHGVACFSTETGAFRFAEWINLSGMKTEEVSFNEARNIAKGRPLPVVSLILLDNIEDPKVHYVR